MRYSISSREMFPYLVNKSTVDCRCLYNNTMHTVLALFVKSRRAVSSDITLHMMEPANASIRRAFTVLLVSEL